MSFFFFFKQKTAYEMRISDWSSDVCSSDLHVAVGQQFAALVPLIFKAGDRPRGDSRSAFQIFGRDPRQGRAAHMIALMLPRLARHPQHRRLAGAGIADDYGKIALADYMLQSGLLLTPQHQAPTPGGVQLP